MSGRKQLERERAVRFLTEAATLTRSGGTVVNARIGRHQEWLPLVEAVSLVRLAQNCHLRTDSQVYSLVVSYGGEQYRFQINPGGFDANNGAK